MVTENFTGVGIFANTQFSDVYVVAGVAIAICNGLIREVANM
jgi:hypothetical protein